MQGQVQYASETWSERVGKGKKGKGKLEQHVDGLWLAYITHYLGQAPAPLCWAERLQALSMTVKGPSQPGLKEVANTNDSSCISKGQPLTTAESHLDL